MQVSLVPLTPLTLHEKEPSLIDNWIKNHTCYEPGEKIRLWQTCCFNKEQSTIDLVRERFDEIYNFLKQAMQKGQTRCQITIAKDGILDYQLLKILNATLVILQEECKLTIKTRPQNKPPKKRCFHVVKLPVLLDFSWESKNDYLDPKPQLPKRLPTVFEQLNNDRRHKKGDALVSFGQDQNKKEFYVHWLIAKQYSPLFEKSENFSNKRGLELPSIQLSEELLEKVMGHMYGIPLVLDSLQEALDLLEVGLFLLSERLENSVVIYIQEHSEHLTGFEMIRLFSIMTRHPIPALNEFWNWILRDKSDFYKECLTKEPVELDLVFNLFLISVFHRNKEMQKDIFTFWKESLSQQHRADILTQMQRVDNKEAIKTILTWAFTSRDSGENPIEQKNFEEAYKQLIETQKTVFV